MAATIRFDAPAGDIASGADVRLIDATLRCIARWGVAKTTLEDVAREAGCSRATVYRACPGGKDALLDTVLRVELERFFTGLKARVEAAPTLEDALVAVVSEAGRTIANHDALQYLLHHEPEVVLPKLAFHELDELLMVVRTVGGPLLSRFLDGDAERSERAAEWVARITLSYTLSPTPGVDTTDETSVRDLVTTFVVPGLVRSAASASADSQGDSRQ